MQVFGWDEVSCSWDSHQFQTKLFNIKKPKITACRANAEFGGEGHIDETIVKDGQIYAYGYFGQNKFFILVVGPEAENAQKRLGDLLNKVWDAVEFNDPKTWVALIHEDKKFINTALAKVRKQTAVENSRLFQDYLTIEDYALVIDKLAFCKDTTSGRTEINVSGPCRRVTRERLAIVMKGKKELCRLNMRVEFRFDLPIRGLSDREQVAWEYPIRPDDVHKFGNTLELSVGPSSVCYRPHIFLRSRHELYKALEICQRQILLPYHLPLPEELQKWFKGFVTDFPKKAIGGDGTNSAYSNLPDVYERELNERIEELDLPPFFSARIMTKLTPIVKKNPQLLEKLYGVTQRVKFDNLSPSALGERILELGGKN
jgi:hypothetical protein